MHRTRYFGLLVDARRYYRRNGWRGWLVFLFNRLRMMLERIVALLIIRIELDQAEMEKRERKAVIEAAKRDPDFNPGLYHEVARRPHRSLLRDLLLSPITGERARRYGEGRKNTDTDSQYDRPIPIEQGLFSTLARFQARKDRHARYAIGRLPQVSSLDDQFEPVGADDDKRHPRSRLN